MVYADARPAIAAVTRVKTENCISTRDEKLTDCGRLLEILKMSEGQKRTEKSDCACETEMSVGNWRAPGKGMDGKKDES